MARGQQANCQLHSDSHPRSRHAKAPSPSCPPVNTNGTRFYGKFPFFVRKYFNRVVFGTGWVCKTWRGVAWRDMSAPLRLAKPRLRSFFFRFSQGLASVVMHRILRVSVSCRAHEASPLCAPQKDKNPNFSQAFNFKTENRPSGGMVVATGLLEWEVSSSLGSAAFVCNPFCFANWWTPPHHHHRNSHTTKAHT